VPRQATFALSSNIRHIGAMPHVDMSARSGTPTDHRHATRPAIGHACSARQRLLAASDGSGTNVTMGPTRRKDALDVAHAGSVVSASGCGMRPPTWVAGRLLGRRSNRVSSTSCASTSRRCCSAGGRRSSNPARVRCTVNVTFVRRRTQSPRLRARVERGVGGKDDAPHNVDPMRTHEREVLPVLRDASPASQGHRRVVPTVASWRARSMRDP
jgi:hypothetical protein